MTTAVREAKTRAGRGKTVGAKRRSKMEHTATESKEAVLDTVFADAPEVPRASGDLPDMVRKNRRERARRRLRDALEARGPYPVPEGLRGELRALVERWGQKGFEDAFPDADVFEIRCAEERAVLEAAARGDEEARFAAAERAYRREIEARHGQIEIRGLQLSARVRQDLEIAYVPLHVEEPSEEPRAAKPRKGAGKRPKGGVTASEAKAASAMLHALERPRVLATDALVNHPRLLIIGEPGSGKSTLLAYLATRAARGELTTSTQGGDRASIPFVVPVRALQEAAATPEEIARAAGAEAWFVEAALQRGRALLLVDGLDEARTHVAGKVLPALTAMLDAYPGIPVVVTTRPAATPGKDEAAPRGFARARLVPMTRDEVAVFIDRWCLAAELSLNKPRGQAEIDARAAADDLKERVRASRAIEKLAQTPLLCSVICVVHRFLGQRIPERRVALYEAITNVLLYEWDRAKFADGAAIGKLDAHAKRALLARLALSMHKARVAELPAEEVVKRLAAHLPDLGRPEEEAEAIVAEIRDRNGVLVERAPGSFAFSHLTFQEYLAAMELVNAHAYNELLRNYKHKWWHEVIVLSAGFPGAHADRIIRGLLDKDGEDVAVGTMLAAQCAETAIEVRQPLRKEIEKRVARLVPPASHTEFETLYFLGELAGPVLVRSLDKASTEGKASIIRLLAFIEYEPATRAILKFLKDPSQTKHPFASISQMQNRPTTLAECAAIFVAYLTNVSETAYSIFLDAIPSADPSAVQALKIWKRIEKDPQQQDKLETLITRAEAAHARASSSVARSPKRATRSG
ncbi:NACHT domain-containing protein [Sorangium atrum]|uniref:NACHT domain-containing protein n=1 Tax=Sorangium atrum TaxID=2995308 RepID=A0ABT5BXA8_9BACT|nr:NACHT domain-containing protein [Sorangium aterium]MDC0678164.1 NACHT domain-containing protein [Sorangium aterium]